MSLQNFFNRLFDNSLNKPVHILALLLVIFITNYSPYSSSAEAIKIYAEPGHIGDVDSALLSHDQSKILTISDGTYGSYVPSITLWNINQKWPAFKVDSFKNEIKSTFFSPNDLLIATSTGDKYRDEELEINFWDVTSGKKHASIIGHEMFAFVDNEHILTVAGKVLNIRSGRVTEDLKTESLYWHTDFYSNGYIVVAEEKNSTEGLSFKEDSGNKITVHSVDGTSFTTQLYNANVQDVVVNEEGTLMAIGYANGAIDLIDLVTNKPTLIPPSSSFKSVLFNLFCESHCVSVAGIEIEPIHALKFTKDGKYLLKAQGHNSYKKLAVDLSTFKEVETNDYAMGLYQPDDSYYGDNYVTLYSFDDASYHKELKVKLRQADSIAVGSFDFLPDNNGILFSSKSAIYQFNFEDSSIRKLDISPNEMEHFSSIAIANDELIIGKSNGISIVDLKTEKLVSEFANAGTFYSAVGDILEDLHLYKNAEHHSNIRQIVTSQDDSIFVTAGLDQDLTVWDTRTREIIDSVKLKGFPRGVALSSDGKRIVVSVYSDGHYISEYDVDIIEVYDLTDKLELSQTVRFDDAPYISASSLSPDGSQLVVGSTMYNLNTRDAVEFTDSFAGFTTTGQLYPGAKGVLSNNSKMVVRFVEKGNIEIADARNNQLLATLYPAEGEWAVLTPDGYFDASENGAQFLRVRSKGKAYSIDQFYETFYRPDIVAQRLTLDVNDKPETQVTLTSIQEVIESVTPPTVSITGASNKEVDADTSDINICLTEQGSGVGRVLIHVNGVNLNLSDSRGLGRADKSSWGQCTVDLNRTIQLSHGENKISVIAYDSTNQIASKPYSITITNTQQIVSKPTLHILALGINEYEDTALALNYSVPDANAMVDTLKSSNRGLYRDVVIHKVLNKQGTKAGLKNAFDKLATSVKPDDVFIFYAAAHGLTVEGRYHLIPQDLVFQSMDDIKRDAIGQGELQGWLANVPALKSVVLLDTCNAGSFSTIASRGLAEKTAIDKLMRATGRATIMASSSNQDALEGYKGHGVFTWTLLEALRGKADIESGNRDGQVSVTELSEYVLDKVPQITVEQFGRKQFPMRNLQGQSFPLAITNK